MYKQMSALKVDVLEVGIAGLHKSLIVMNDSIPKQHWP